jgi:hypothetical protein
MADVLIRELRSIFKSIDDLNRRLTASQMTGRVAAVDGSRVRIELSPAGANGQPFLSPWVQLQEAAGATGTNMPVAVGDPVRLLSPNGEIGSQSLAIRDSHTDDKSNPAAKPDELAITHGNSALRMTADGLTLSHGGTSLQLTADTVKALSAKLLHNDKNVGDDHKHTGVERGSSQTGNPT